MPRVHTVKKARKDYPNQGIQKGDTYYWWEFRFGGKVRSKTYPKPSQLTQSEFLGTLYDIEERLGDLTLDDVEEGCLDDIISELENLRDETQDKWDNIPEQLQDTSDAGMLLQERVDSLEEFISDLENVDLSVDEGDFTPECPNCGEYLDDLTSNMEKCEGCGEDLDRDALEEQKEEFLTEQKENILGEIQECTYNGS